MTTASIPDLKNLPTHSADGRPIAYFTFDDGPHPPYTQGVLDVMKRHDGQCTFFVVGQNVRKHPQLVRSIAAAGHYIANHTYTHPSLPELSHEQFMEEMESTQQIIMEAAGELLRLNGGIRYMRPPYGHVNEQTQSYAAELGYALVLWDIYPWDWNTPGTEAIVEHVLPRIYPGAIILLHDGGGDRSQTVEALSIILNKLSAQNYKFHSIYMP